MQSNPDLGVEAYRGNPFIEACGEIPDRTALIQTLSRFPNLPGHVGDIPIHMRRHLVPTVRDLYIPSPETLRVGETIDLMLRQGYVRRRPGSHEFWNLFYQREPVTVTSIGAAVMGISGVGKTAAIESSLHRYAVFVDHHKLSGFIGTFRQLLWIKVDAPESGRLSELAANLMIATDEALGSDYFSKTLAKDRRSGAAMFSEWLAVAKKHVLGLIVIDEIQNLFKLAPVKKRRQNSQAEKLELRIVEDETLKLILTVTNTWRIPILIAGTPDGMAAFQTRFSAAQRLITDGFHVIRPPASADDVLFSTIMFPALARYQWVQHKLPDTQEFRQLIFEMTAGIPRIYIALWGAAHRVCFDRADDTLTFDDFRIAMATYLSPLIPAINAYQSGRPDKLRLYEDIMQRGSVL